MAYAIDSGVIAVLLAILWRKSSTKGVTFQKQYSHDNGRHFGVMEKLMSQGHDRDGYLILANTVVLRSKKQITGPVVRKAMELLMKRHPMLRICTRKDQNGECCLQKMANIHVDIRELDTTDWRTIMEDSLLEKFDGENGPLWRVIFLPNARYEPDTEEDILDMLSYPHECICVFGFHHIVADGPSYIRMFGECMKYIDKLINNKEPEITSMAMLPPLDLYMDDVIQAQWYHHIMQLVFKLLSIIPGFPDFKKSGIRYGGNAFTRKHGVEIQRNPKIQPGTKIVPVEFTKVQTSSLLKSCKEHQTTVQGAVQTAAGVAMATLLEEQECKVECNISVNARSFLKSKVPDDYAGVYCLGLGCQNLVMSSPDAETFWVIAKQASTDLHTRLNKNEHMKMWLRLKRLFPVITRIMCGVTKAKDDRSGQRNGQLVVFTNLGYAKFLDRSPDDDVILRARFWLFCRASAWYYLCQ